MADEKSFGDEIMVVAEWIREGDEGSVRQPDPNQLEGWAGRVDVLQAEHKTQREALEWAKEHIDRTGCQHPECMNGALPGGRKCDWCAMVLAVEKALAQVKS